MATRATLMSQESLYTTPQYIVGRWQYTGTDATSFLEIMIPSYDYNLNQGNPRTPHQRTNFDCAGIVLKVFSTSNGSTNFDISVLNMDDVTKINTIYEVIKYTSVNRVVADEDFENFIIPNADSPSQSKLYLFYVNNNIVTPFNTIDIQLIYVPINKLQ